MTIRTRLTGTPVTLPCVVAMSADATFHAVVKPRTGLSTDCHLRGVSTLQDSMALKKCTAAMVFNAPNV
mgnify:CR=1 FL=1